MMWRFSKQQKIIAFGICAAVAFGVFVFQQRGLVIGHRENQTDVRLEIGIWTTTTLIEQTFTASQPQLTRIDFWIDSYRPWDSPSLECRLFEFDGQQPVAALSYHELRAHLKEVRARRLNGWLLSPHMFNAFAFEPLPDSQGKRYLFAISSPNLRRGGSSILLASARKRLDHELFFVDGARKDHDLAFRALYARPSIELIQNTAARLALQKPAPFSSSAFYYLLFGSYLAMMIFFIRRL